MRVVRVYVRLLLFIAALLPLPASRAAPRIEAIRFGKLVDGTGRVLTNAVVIVEGDRIKSVGAAVSSIPAGAKVLDLSRYTGIPGLIESSSICLTRVVSIASLLTIRSSRRTASTRATSNCPTRTQS